MLFIYCFIELFKIFMISEKLIDSVVVKELKVLSDWRGSLIEMLRSDWPLFKGFGQVYVTMCKPGIAKAWHYHKKQTDNFVAVNGNAKVALYDARKDSETFGLVNEFRIGEKNPMLIQIPPFVYHGFAAVGKKSAYIINVPNRLYDYKKPDEYRLPFNTPDIPYDWKVKKGG